MKVHEENSLYYIFCQVIRLHYHRTHDLLDKIGLYPGQPAMLFAICKEDGQSQKDLANKIRIKPATITVMLNRMEKAGLVERKQDKEDQRISRVYITKEGKEIFNEVNKIMETIDEECFYNFTEEEQILLRRLLMQVKDNLMKECNK